MKKYTFLATMIFKKSNLGWNNRIPVPEEIAEKLIASSSKNNKKRVICTIENKVEYHCALIPDGMGQHYIIVNQKHKKMLELLDKTEWQIHLKNDHSKYGIALPKEMELLLEQDEIGKKFFESLSPGKKRSLLHIVGLSKSEPIRIKKAITILNYLISTQGKLDFKELNEAFKKANQ